jgi:hypothetical protein
MAKILISFKEVEDYLESIENTPQETRKEIIDTLCQIQEKDGRKWIFSHVTKKYYIDEYNQYDDFVKTYIFNQE